MSRRFRGAILQLHAIASPSRQESFPLDKINRITGVVRELQIPREAMGRGDLKFLAAIGVFLGWRAVLCSIFAGSLAGSLVGLGSLLFGKRAWSAKIPFGPYLAAGRTHLDVFRRAPGGLVCRFARHLNRRG